MTTREVLAHDHLARSATALMCHVANHILGMLRAWRWSYDYEVDGERDISDLDDKNFVRLRRKRNKIITLMYSVVLIMFILSMSLLSQILIFFLN